MKVWHNLYRNLITKTNIFRCYKEFRVGKKKKKDVIIFEASRQENLTQLYTNLQERKYKPKGYTGFYIKDPKLRLIHKAAVIDRVVHHIASSQLEKIYEPIYIEHSYSCRKDKGTHRGVITFQKMALKVSRNNTRVCWVLKLDIKKFFASVNHKILIEILSGKIKDEDFLNLLRIIVKSFYSDRTIKLQDKKGIPIGNLTSQLFSNIYLNELDQFLKHQLKVKYYLRYADDFVILHTQRSYLEDIISPIRDFLQNELDLELHPQKIIFRKFNSGIDFLGYVIFPKFILPRTSTKKRLIRKIRQKVRQYKLGEITKDTLNQTIQSYYGFLTHANAHKFKKELENMIWFWLTE